MEVSRAERKAFIGLNRGILDHWIYQDAEYLKVWIEMLFCARYKKEPETKMVEGHLVKLEYSQFIFGRIKWSQRIGISERRLRTLLDKMQADGMIQLVKRTPKFSVYRVTNYAKYRPSKDHQETLETEGFEDVSDQQVDQQTTSECPANDQQATTKEQSKQGKQGNKGINYTPEFEGFWSVYPRKVEKQAAFTKWKTAIKTEEPSVIILCASNYAKNCEIKNTDMDYIKHPKTFLNKENYKDHLLTVVGGVGGAKYGRSDERNEEANRRAADEDSDLYITTV